MYQQLITVKMGANCLLLILWDILPVIGKVLAWLRASRTENDTLSFLCAIRPPGIMTAPRSFQQFQMAPLACHPQELSVTILKK